MKVKVTNRDDIARFIEAVRIGQGLSRNQLLLKMSAMRGTQMTSKQVNSLESGDGAPTYNIELLLDAARALGVYIILRSSGDDEEV